LRDRLVAERTALINQLRAVLMERGIIIPQGRRKLNYALAAILEGDEEALSPRVRGLINDMRSEWGELDRRICAFDNEFAARAREDEGARRLATIPGIGVLNATAPVAVIGDGQSFARGRDLSAWLGLVPRQQTTGGKPRLKGITKRGNVYLRKLLIHGARAAMTPLSGTDTALGRVVARPASAGACEHRCRSACQQASPDRLGGAAHWAELRSARLLL